MHKVRPIQVMLTTKRSKQALEIADNNKAEPRRRCTPYILALRFSRKFYKYCLPTTLMNICIRRFYILGTMQKC